MEQVSLWLPSHPGEEEKRGVKQESKTNVNMCLSLSRLSAVLWVGRAFYLVTLAHNLSSFYCGVDAVGHVEQEDPGSGWHTLDKHALLQLEANTQLANSNFFFCCELTVLAFCVVCWIDISLWDSPFHPVSALPEAHRGAKKARCHRKTLIRQVSREWSGLDWHPDLNKQTKTNAKLAFVCCCMLLKWLQYRSTWFEASS